MVKLKANRGASRREQHSIQFKVRVIHDVEAGGSTQEEIANKYRINQSLVSKWNKSKTKIMAAAVDAHTKLYLSFSTSQPPLILKIFLKFRKFQPRYSFKIYSYIKKECTCTHKSLNYPVNLEKCNVHNILQPYQVSRYHLFVISSANNMRNCLVQS